MKTVVVLQLARANGFQKFEDLRKGAKKVDLDTAEGDSAAASAVTVSAQEQALLFSIQCVSCRSPVCFSGGQGKQRVPA